MMIDTDKLKRNPEAAARFMTFMEYERPQIRRFLIEECGCTAPEAERLATKAADEYDDDSPKEYEDEPLPLGEVARHEGEDDRQRAVAAEQDLTKSNWRS